jgi:uncharacterized membrane protein YebE (DUF533 family)
MPETESSTHVRRNNENEPGLYGSGTQERVDTLESQNMKNLGILRTMLTMAMADGGISREELRLLTQRAVQWDFSDEDFENLLDNDAEQGSAVEIPDSMSDRMEMLRQLVLMMGADGKLEDREKRFFAVVAAKLGISVDQLHQIIDAAIKDPS